ncbi:hypothetical protein Y032_0183g948 [Ancylostoma ceylanicum]|uniref:SCP domain-containing protein n=1 Tax=Ancylostoma ceylanicum TaxID=53326 RepID=A0A016SSJ2_9BILA|nr:hypothetical protein Y032_0183g948 [Ancylostoma ceylanicum]
MEAWYKEIKTGHMNQATGSQNLLLPTLNITNYAKMIWDSHEKVGCAVFQCKTTKNVVCHYSPNDAKLGSTIYTMGGQICRQCTNINTVCEQSTGLCVRP